MRKTILILILVIIFTGVIYGLYQHNAQKETTPSIENGSASPVSFNPADDLGTYAYRCKDGMEFNAHFLDAGHVVLMPISASMYVPPGILSFSTTSSGTLYRNTEASFYGHGETVQVTTASSTTVCSPQTAHDEAPMNFGD